MHHHTYFIYGLVIYYMTEIFSWSNTKIKKYFIEIGLYLLLLQIQVRSLQVL